MKVFGEGPFTVQRLCGYGHFYVANKAGVNALSTLFTSVEEAGRVCANLNEDKRVETLLPVPRLQTEPNPPGWNEPGMQPINWADRGDVALAERMAIDSGDVVDKHYQIAFEQWERQRTKPETRWEFADRMAKQEG